ncbi:ABC transporter substrate-binding protein [Brachybacterium timonense]|uniref:ABC transporter substrate-binding protein n=1 Tax=Brachybacterium timonense TaxID=2050896 RepID=UPI001BB080A5|nr:ABC transporter substrate-binding protein [Brachybacterium timonense]
MPTMPTPSRSRAAHGRPSPRTTLRPSRRALLTAGTLGAPLLAAGCSRANGGNAFGQVDGDTPEEYRKRSRVVAWSPWGGKPGAAFAAAATAFNESQQDIYVEVQAFDGYDGTETRFATALQARSIPDLIGLGDMSWQRFFLNEVLEPLDGYFGGDFTEDVYNPTLLEEGRLKDQIWWVPQGRSTPLFYYNKEILQAAGLPDRAPDTWTEFREWGKEVKGLTHNGETVSMRAYTAGDDWYIQGLVWAFGGQLSDEELTLTLEEQPVLDALAFDRAVLHEDKSSYVAAEMAQDFTAGLAATICSSTGSLGGISESAEFDFGAGFLPKEVDTGVPTGGGGLAIPRHASDERKQAAWEFMKFLASPEQSTSWVLETGYLPNTVAAETSSELAQRISEQPAFGVAIEQLKIARQPDYIRRFVPATVPEMRTVIQRVNVDNEDPAAVVADAARAIEDVAGPTREKFQEVMGK